MDSLLTPEKTPLKRPAEEEAEDPRNHRVKRDTGDNVDKIGEYSVKCEAFKKKK